jgi:hypothetical protein
LRASVRPRAGRITVPLLTPAARARLPQRRPQQRILQAGLKARSDALLFATRPPKNDKRSIERTFSSVAWALGSQSWDGREGEIGIEMWNGCGRRFMIRTVV